MQMMMQFLKFQLKVRLLWIAIDWFHKKHYGNQLIKCSLLVNEIFYQQAKTANFHGDQ